MMRTMNRIAMAALMVGLVSSAGCWFVPEADLKRCQDQNRILIEEKAELREQNRKLEDDVMRLQSELAGGDPNSQELFELRQAYADIRASYDQLNAEYQALLMQEGPPLPAEVNIELQQLAEQFGDVIEYTPRRGMIKFKADLTFARGSVAITDEAKQVLARLAEIVNSPAAAQFHVYVAGHTDDIPIVREETRRHHPNNWYLSVHRAIEVQEVLEAGGVAAGRTSVMGFGQHHPTAPNAPNHGGNELNRRVEVWLLPPSQFLTTEP